MLTAFRALGTVSISVTSKQEHTFALKFLSVEIGVPSSGITPSFLKRDRL